ncbi:MAG: eCIS core domain-containing protein [Candidatus Limnocylindrales bacterium]
MTPRADDRHQVPPARQAGDIQRHEREADAVADRAAMPSRRRPSSLAGDQSSGRGDATLDAPPRAHAEAQLGHRFADVRIHADGGAGRPVEGFDSLAYTVGRDIFFAPGHYRPATREGQRLILHELTHVRQQAQGAAPIAPQHQQGSPRPAPVDADAQRIIDLAADTSRPIAERAVAVVRAIVDRYYAADAARISGITYREGEPGLEVSYSGRAAATTGALTVGRYFVENTIQRHFARRVAQVGHEIEHVGQVRGGMVGPSRSDEREFLAFYHEGLFTEPTGTGRMQHSTRVPIIDAALAYYCCFDAELQRTHQTKRDELVTRRASEVRASGRDDLGTVPTACRRASH